MSEPHNGTILIDEEGSRVSKITIRVPPFWPDDPELWFAQLEGQFALCNITKDETKYAHVLSRIEPKQAREIRDVITQPPSAGKYEAIKKALIQRLTDSQEQRIRQLLEHEELGDRKPSQFLRHLNALAGTTVSGELLRTLWLGRLPTQMQAILATRTEDDLDDVAEQADRIYEVGHKSVVLATTAPTANQSPWEAQIEALGKQVAALTTQMTKMAKSMKKNQSRDYRGRSRSRSWSRPRDRARSKTPQDKEICFYHRRWGAEAERCTLPCKFKALNTKNEGGSQ